MTRALVSAWVVVQVQLMVLLGIPPLSRRQNLRCHTALPPLLVDLVGDLARNLLLLGVVVKDGTAVLRATVWALLILCGWIVHLVEELEKSAVCNLLRIVYYLERFGIYSNKGISHSFRHQ